jgi:drug/metabolite transporter (DMT)-like permease
LAFDVSVLLALLSAFSYGVSDFLAALATRRLLVLRATTIGYGFAALVVLAAWFLDPGHWTPGATLAGLVAGALSVIGFLGFYAALAIGPMSVLSPVMAVLGSLVPVLVALLRGDALSPLALIAIAAAVLAAGLVSIERDRARRVSPRAALYALVGGVGLGASVAALDFAPSGSGLIPAVVEILVGFALVALLLALVRPPKPEGAVRIAYTQGAAGGALLGAANALLVVALAAGSLAVVSVIVGLYPVVTVLLATIVTREQISAVQTTGIVIAIAASVLLALA